MSEWFAPKRYGYGAGLPIAWQGWLVLALFLVALLAAVLLLDGDRLAHAAIVFPAVALLLLIAARTTRGGWRWRWGDKK